MAEKQQHSPGPWSVGDHTHITDANGDLIGTVRFAYARMHLVDELAANARLIAAAPDLLAVCEAALAQHDAYCAARGGEVPFAEGCREIYEAMKTAVAKAKGGAP